MINYLIVGVGGTGSEVIKLLIRSQCDITVIDYDKIELSNLCRQFYFSHEDIGKYKAEVIGKRLDLQYIVGDINDIEFHFFDKFDVVFSCVDNIPTRFQINYMFKLSQCKMLIDLGVEGFKMHAKKVTSNTSCLYCIKELYKTENETYLCTLCGDIEINCFNREKMLKTIVLINKETKTPQEIVDIFNDKITDLQLKTDLFEVKGIYNNIIPNIAVLNAICASLSVILMHDDEYDYIFYNGEGDTYLTKQAIQKEENCIVCNLISKN